MSGCIVFKTCQLHRTVAQWLHDGNVRAIQEHRDVIEAIAPRAWHRCSCGLWARIQPILTEPMADAQ